MERKMRSGKRRFDPTGGDRSVSDPKRQKTPELAREPEKPLEIQGSQVPREKRGLDLTGAEGSCSCLKKQKTPKLMGVIMRALAVNNANKLMSCLEPMIDRTIRKAVSEALDHVLLVLGPARSVERVTEVPDGRNLQLHFKTGLLLPLYTGAKVEGEKKAAIHLALLDADTGDVVTSGPESSAKLDVIVLEGDFGYENDENWSKEDFGKRILRGREGKGSLLTGNLQVSLKEGIGTLGDLKFCDNSSWTRTKMFRLGLKVSSGFSEGIRIREAITEAFAVLDHRGVAYKKHYPPLPKDDIWRLKSIRMDGPFHKNLNKSGVHTVEDFLRFYARDPHKLRQFLERGMSDKMWKSLIEHAKTCPLDVFSADDLRNIGSNQLASPSSLNSEKVLGKEAYGEWGNVIECDNHCIKHDKKSMPMQSEFQCFANHQASTQDHVSVLASSQPLYDEVVARVYGPTVGCCDSDQVTEHTSHSDGANFTSNFQDEDTTYAQKELLNGSPELVEAECGITGGQELVDSEEPLNSSQPVDQLVEISNLNSFTPFANLPYDHEEMQRHVYDTYMPTCSPTDLHWTPIWSFDDFGDGQGHSAAKALYGWLKIKDAMRGGIFLKREISS